MQIPEGRTKSVYASSTPRRRKKETGKGKCNEIVVQILTERGNQEGQVNVCSGSGDGGPRAHPVPNNILQNNPVRLYGTYTCSNQEN
jgi:hypothetical protein